MTKALDSTTPKSLLVGLIGSGIGRSLTPAMHIQEGHRQGLSYDYRLIDTAGMADSPDLLPRLLDQAQREGYRGLNITHPFKQQVVGLLDEVSPDVEALGACNTVVFEGGTRRGHNTDWTGFQRSFERGLPGVALGHVVQVGAGGAGAATAYALLVMGTDQIEIFDLDAERASGLVSRLNGLGRGSRARVVDDLAASLSRSDGVVQATAVGMDAHPGTPFEALLLSPRQWLAEVIYFPRRTALLESADRIGCRTLGGGGMAVFQAVAAFELFTGRPANAADMLEHFESLAAMS